MGLTQGQRRCVETMDAPLVVAAGAGSGKTHTLTERIAHAFETGFVTDIDELCAITFTNKAAAELKSRIKGKLRAIGLVDQALRADEAWVSTIHGMCARILRAHAVELGINLAFSVAGEVQVSAYLAQAVDDVLARERTGDLSDRVDALFAEYAARSAGGRGSSVEGMVRQLVIEASAHPDGMGAFVMPGVTLAPHIAFDQAICLLEGLLDDAASQKESVKRDEWMASCADAVQTARAAQAAGDVGCGEALALLGGVKLAKTFGSKEYKARVDEARGEFGALLMELRLALARPHLEVLLELAGRALHVFGELKRANGVLDNNDLLVLAARAIEEHPSIAERYADKFKLVMVDEFQDTDQMQVDMIKKIAGPGARRLCTVGDAQQSIYRFRGADVSVYRRHLDDVEATDPASIIRLSDNFRSHGDVLGFVDRVFEKPDMFGGAFMSLRASRAEELVKAPFKGDGPRIVVQHTTAPWRGVSAAALCEVTARRIAGAFAALKQAGHSAGDMVVLLGRMSNAGVFAKALRDVGLSCVITGGSVFAGTQEAQTVRELVHALANPRETQSLFNVLTSPLFCLTAGDLMGAGGVEGFARLSPEEAEGVSVRLACAQRVMARAWRLVRDEPVSRIVERVMDESGWLSRLEQRGPEGLASAANAYKAVRILGDVERAGACGPLSAMRRFDEALASSKEAPGALSVSGGDSVRIMTVHASKGLEFPIVAVAEMKDSGAPRSRLLTASVGGRVYVSLDAGRSLDAAGGAAGTAGAAGDDAVRDYVLGLVAGEEELAQEVVRDAGALHRRLALRDYIAAGDDEEAKRLLYVALTRAKEALVVSATGKRTSKDPFGAPKNALAGVLSALDPEGRGFTEGRNECAFGGTRAALVDIVVLEADGGAGVGADGAVAAGAVAAGAGGAVGAATAASATAASDGGPFMVPVAPAVARDVPRDVYRPAREGVFSYSSVAEASHGGSLLDELARDFAVSVDEAADDDGIGWDGVPAAVPSAFGGSFEEDGGGVFDEDRATDLGTAFHRLAQHAVVARGGQGPLVAPPEERVAALARSCGLDGLQQQRLRRALERWFASDVARDAAGLADLSAEVPFFVAAGDAFLEGEIDLMGYDEARTHVKVIDYKTGGSVAEGPDELRRKHVLQAACYAYAVLLQGAEQVDATFVRVERSRADDAGQPQCVRYRFSSGDLERLRCAIAQAYQATCDADGGPHA